MVAVATQSRVVSLGRLPLATHLGSGGQVIVCLHKRRVRQLEAAAGGQLTAAQKDEATPGQRQARACGAAVARLRRALVPGLSAQE